MKFIIKNLGCKTNAIEGGIMVENLLKSGFEETNNELEADYFIINSCAVTHHASIQAKYLLGKAKKENPKIKVVLTGCCAQSEDLEKDIFDIVLGNSEKLRIAYFLKEEKSSVEDIFKIKEFENKFVYKTKSTRPQVKIQDGCNNRCSYCLIPFLRGNSRSNSISNIIEQINIFVRENKKEVVLTGIHLGQWGVDLGNLKLIDLLYEVEKTDILRYRLGSLYVNEVDSELFSFLAKSKKFCPHFHLSIQSMCDKTLKNMNRFYTKNEVFCLIKKIKENFNLPYIGCDIISGFPKETDEDFLETKNALIESKVSYIHSFPYSKRKGTKASNMEGQILEHVKKKRAQEINEVCKMLHKNFLDENKNTKRTLIYEKEGKNGLYQGVSENYIKVYRKSNTNLQGKVETVNLSEFLELH